MEDCLHRNKLWQPESLQSAISGASVVVGGIGGLGWQISSALIGLGVSKLAIFDPDTLERTNLNRLWGCRPSDIGQPKVDVFKQLAIGVKSDLDIRCYQQSIPCQSFEREVRQADVVFGAYDQPEARLATQVLTRSNNVLYLDSGVGLKMHNTSYQGYGQVFYDDCSHTPCIVCCGLRQDSSGYHFFNGAPLPSSGVLNGHLANLAVSIWLQHLEGKAIPAITRFKWNTLQLEQTKNLESEDSCPICGIRPSWKFKIQESLTPPMTLSAE